MIDHPALGIGSALARAEVHAFEVLASKMLGAIWVDLTLRSASIQFRGHPRTFTKVTFFRTCN